MRIHRVTASHLVNVPITPPPFLKEPSRGSIVVTEIETDDGLTGYGSCGSYPTSVVEFINREAASFKA